MAKLLTAVNAALRDVELRPRDEAAAELARTYARRVDAGEPADKLGPPLLACLVSLGMTPAARGALAKGGQDAGPAKPANPLDELRARREQRAAG